MFSDVIKTALEREVIGQSWAINGTVRGVTRVASGLTPRERPFCAYLFVGPTGTGKTHLVRTLARVLHGDERRMAVADCSLFPYGDPWMGFVTQLAPLFVAPRVDDRWTVLEAPPLSIIRIEYLERGPKEIVKTLAAALETGQILLPQGRRGSLRNCLVFLTSSLCSKEILDEAPQIGFSGSQSEEDGEQEKIYKVCQEKAEEQLGTDLMGRLDSMIVFHKVREADLSQILDRRVGRLQQWLAPRGFRCEMSDEAKAFLLERGSVDLRQGARNLMRAHRKFVEFPLSDLLISGRIPPGGLIRVDRISEECHLHFTVTQAAETGEVMPPSHEVPVAWEDDRQATVASA